MSELKKPYLLNLTVLERAFVEEMAWRRRKKLSEYFKSVLNREMQENPDVVKLVSERVKNNEGV